MLMSTLLFWIELKLEELDLLDVEERLALLLDELTETEPRLLELTITLEILVWLLLTLDKLAELKAELTFDVELIRDATLTPILD